MRSLFAKILLWFLAASAITLFGYVLTTSISASAARGRANIFSRLIAFQLVEARNAYETDGKQGLKDFLSRYASVFPGEASLTDENGKDLLTGANRSELIEQARQEPAARLFGGGRIAFARNSEDGRYWFLVRVARQRNWHSFFLPQYLWILGAVILLSYLLALHLTSPLRRLERAVERFGQGDFEARARSRRKDELGKLARAFDLMAERIKTLLTAERRLLLDISHELRSPLARLSVAVELAREEEDREDALNRIEKEASRLNALVTELLQVTRAEGDPASRHTEPVRVDELVAAIVDDCALEAGARGCTLDFHPQEPVTVEGDPELLRRAVENVVRNAIRYAPPETAISVALERCNGTAQVRVRDQGPGVPDEALPRIFDPFYRVQADRNRASGGTGLGLSIARRAVELHNGVIVARNANPGLEVQIDLPVAAPVAAR